MQGIQRLLLFGTLGLVIIILGSLILLDDGPSEEDLAKEKKRKQISLLMGGSSGSNGNSESGNGGKGKSVFDSDFYSAGNARYVEESETQPYDLPKGEIPVNPQTGKPYTEEEMAMFEELRKKFPDNDLIPKRLTPEEKKFKEEREQKLASATRSVFNKSATPQQIQMYYDHVVDQAQDRMQIINYILEDEETVQDFENPEQLKQIHENIQKQLDAAVEGRNKAFQEAGLPLGG